MESISVVSLIVTGVATVAMAAIGFFMYRLSAKSAENTDRLIQYLFKRIEAALYASGRSVGNLETFVRESEAARKVLDSKQHENDGNADVKNDDCPKDRF